MNQMKKIVASLMVVTILMGMIPATASAAGTGSSAVTSVYFATTGGTGITSATLNVTPSINSSSITFSKEAMTVQVMAVLANGSTVNVSSLATCSFTDGLVATTTDLDDSFYIQAVTSGSAGFTAAYGGQSVTLAVMVPVYLTSLTLSASKFEVFEGCTIQAQVVGNYSDGSQKFLTDDYDFSCVSGSESLIDVAADGKVTGKTAGTAYLTATDENGNTIKSAINVYEVKSFTAPAVEVALGVRAELAVSATVTSTTDSTPDVLSQASYVSADPTIAEVNQAGEVIGTGIGTTTITATYMGKTVDILVTVGGAAYISTTTASYNQNATTAAHADISLSVTNADTLTSIKNGETPLVLGTDYTVTDRVVTIKTSYLDTLTTGSQSLVFTFSGGTATLAVTVTNSQDSTVSTDVAVFDKNTAGGDYADLVFAMNLNDNTLMAIQKSGTPLTLDTNYTVSGNTVTIKKEYLASLSADVYTLTFVFNQGASYSCKIGIVDSSELIGCGTALDSDGNKYYFETNYLVEVPAEDGTQRGRYMKQGTPYIVAGIGGDQATIGSGDKVPATAGTVDYIKGVAVDTDGNLYICGGQSLYEVPATDGTQWGIKMKTGYLYNLYTACQNLTNKQLALSDQVTPIAVDSEGNVYFFSYAGQKINFMAAEAGTRFGIEMNAGETYTIAGGNSAYYTADGTLATDSSTSLNGLAIDQAGNVYYTRTVYNTVYMISENNEVHFDRAMMAGSFYRLAGTYNDTGYSGDGENALTAQLNHPRNIAVDSAGNVFFYDRDNSLIRVIANSTELNEVSMTPGNIYTVFKRGTAPVLSLWFMEDGDIWYYTATGLTPLYTDTAENPYSGNADLKSVKGISVACSGSNDPDKPHNVGNFILGASNSAIPAAAIVPDDSTAKLTMYSDKYVNTTTAFGSGTYIFTITAQDGRISYYKMTVAESEDSADGINQDGSGIYLHNYKADQLYRVFGQTLKSTSTAAYRIGTGTATDPGVRNIWVDSSMSRVETTDLELFNDATAQLHFCGTDSTFTNTTTDGVNLEPGETTTVYFYITADGITDPYYYYQLNIIRPALVEDSTFFLKTMFNRPVHFARFVYPESLSHNNSNFVVNASIYLDSSITSISNADMGIAANTEVNINGISNQLGSVVLSYDGITRLHFDMADDNGTQSYNITIIQKAKLLSAEAGISTVLGKTAAVSGSGSVASPLLITVDADNSVTTVGASDIVPTDSNLATVQFYGTDSNFATAADSTTLTAGANKVYATVTAQDGAVLYYEITVNHTAVPTITTTTLPGVTINTAYSQTLAVTGTTPITWSLDIGSLLPDGLTLATDTGIISGTPTTAGNYTFTVKAENSLGFDTQELRILVSAVNNPPTAKTPVPTQSAAVSGTTDFTASAIADDADSDTLTITGIVTAPNSTYATASLTSGTIAITGVAVGSTSIVVTVSDGKGGAVDVTVPIEVTAAAPSNHAPTAKTPVPSQSITVGSDASFNASAIADDADSGDTLTITSIVTAPNSTYATASLTSGTITITGVAVGNTSIVVTVSDGKGGTVDVTVPITVTASAPSNHAPTVKATIPSQSMTVGSNASFNAPAIADDADSDTLTITSIVTAPNSTYATASLTSGTITITGVAAGSTSIVVTVSDGKGGTVNVTVPIEVTAIPDLEISITQSPVKTILNAITFGLFFDKSIDVSIASVDSAVEHYEYQLVASGSTFDADGTWTTGHSFSINPDFKGKIYTRAVYSGGLVSDTVVKALVVDTTKPVISASYDADIASIDVTVTDSGAGIQAIAYQICSNGAQQINLEPTEIKDITTVHQFTISGLPDGKYDVVINAIDNSGIAADTKTIAVDRTVINDATISPTSATYDLAAPANVSTTITWNGASSVTGVVYGAANLSADSYVVSASTLIIKSDYIETLSLTEGDAAEFIISFNVGNPVTFTVNAVDNYIPSSNAKLSGLTVNGDTVSGFAPNTTTYNVELPYGTASVTVGATADDSLAEVVITQAGSLPGSASVAVTAEDKITQKTYTINFTIGEAPNNAPTAKSTVPTQSVTGIGNTSFNASNIAKDEDGDTLTIIETVTLPDSVIATSALNNGVVTVTGVSAGSTSIVVKVSDGTDTVNVTVPITVIASQATSKTLTSVTAPASIIGVANGTAKTASALGLPSTVTLVTDKGTVSASVTWAVASCTYDASSTNAQTFTVSGTVALPDGVVNTNSVSLSTSISVTVNAASGSGGGGGSSSGSGSSGATDSSSSVTVKTDAGTTTATQTFTAMTGSNGVAAASVTGTQISDMIAAADKKAAEANTQTALTINVDTGSGATGVSVTIPQAAASSLSDGVNALTISSPVVTVTFDEKALAEIGKNTTGDITITAVEPDDTALSDQDKATIGDRPVYDLKITSGSTTISSFGGGTATVSVPYTPAAGEDTSKIVVYYISGSGELIMVPDCVYDSSTGNVTFKTTHFSSYAVGYNDISFTDVSDSAWYADYVSYLAARKIINGTGDEKFSPDANITRAEFVTILANLSGDDLSGYTSSSFSDVATTNWYFAAVQWASKNGIASGYDGKFNPGSNITREQMAAMLYNYAKYVGNASNVEGMSVREFTDYDSISSWALQPIQWAMNNSIISGNTDGSFTPAANATRAQAAKMIAVFMQGMIK